MSLNRYLIQNRNSQTPKSGCSLLGRILSPLKTLGGFFGVFLVVIMMALIAVGFWTKNSQQADRTKLLEASDDYIETLRELVRADPKTVKTLLGAEVVILFGVPHFERHDQGSIVWQYKTPFCVMDLFFFPRGDEAMERVAVNYADVRDSAGQPLKDKAVPECFKALTSSP